MSAKQCIVIGCGSHASSIISIIESSVECYEILGLVDTAESFDPQESKSGYNVIFNIAELIECSDKYIHLYCVLAIGDNQERKKIFDILVRNNFKLPNIISSNSLIDRTVIMGKGNIIAHTAFKNAKTTLGDNNLINSGALIEHDCVIANHTSFGPKAVLCGGVTISNFVTVGAGAVIIQSIFVEKASTVAAGAVLVRNNYEESSILIGVPARDKRI